MFNFVQKIKEHNFKVAKGADGAALDFLETLFGLASEVREKIIRIEIKIPDYARSCQTHAKCIYKNSQKSLNIDVLGFEYGIGLDDKEMERFLNELNFYIGSKDNKITRYGGVIKF